MIAGIPYWRLSSFYFFYFMLVGTLQPYLSLYLVDIGYTAYAVGLVNAVLMGTKIISPNVWGWLCERTGKRLRIISIGSFVAMMTFTGLFYWQALLPVLLVTFIYSFFWNAVLSQFDVVTLQYLKDDTHRYSHVRLWGSIGFILAVLGLGWFFDHFSIQWLISVCCVFLALIWISGLTINDPGDAISQPDIGHWFDVLKHSPVIVFLVAVFLLQCSFGSYYSFFSLHLESYGYSRTTISALWALGVIAEVLLFIFISQIAARVSMAHLLFYSLLLTGGRWLLTAFFADSLMIMVFTQLLHAFSFGAAHAACIELIHRFFRRRNEGQGQALYSTIGFGAGGAVGAIVGGLLWDYSPQLLFSVSAIAAIVAAWVLWLGLIRD